MVNDGEAKRAASAASARYDASEDELQRYREQGYFTRLGALPLDVVGRVRDAVERVASATAYDAARSCDVYAVDGNRYAEVPGSTVQYEHREGSATLRVIEPFHHLDSVFEELIDDPRLVDPICGILEEGAAALWTEKINLKRPREGSGFRWHQDSPYWRHVCDHCDRLPNVMVALDDASEANGCFRLVPGTHRRGFLPGIQDATRLGPLFTEPGCFDESRQVALEVSAGSLIFFDSHVVHGSQPNRSARPRRALVITYQPPGHSMFKAEGLRAVAPSGALSA